MHFTIHNIPLRHILCIVNSFDANCISRPSLYNSKLVRSQGFHCIPVFLFMLQWHYSIIYILEAKLNLSIFLPSPPDCLQRMQVGMNVNPYPCTNCMCKVCG